MGGDHECTCTVTSKPVLMVTFAVPGADLGSFWAGMNGWTSIGPEGGRVRALAIDPQKPEYGIRGG